MPQPLDRDPGTRRSLSARRNVAEAARPGARRPEARETKAGGMTLEQFLARIYVDREARARFLADPRAEAARAGLPEDQCRALEGIDRVGLEMAARSFARKRSPHRNDRLPEWKLF